MWVHKKEWEEMKKKIADLEEKVQSRPSDDIAKDVKNTVMNTINQEVISSGKNPLIF